MYATEMQRLQSFVLFVKQNRSAVNIKFNIITDDKF